MSTAGARHLAESENWLAAQSAPAVEPEPEPETVVAVAPLVEVAATHDGQPPLTWLQMFYRKYCGLFDA